MRLFFFFLFFRKNFRPSAPLVSCPSHLPLAALFLATTAYLFAGRASHNVHAALTNHCGLFFFWDRQAMIDEFDLDQDGEINEQEFIAILMEEH